jgi:hypothetical protein
MPPANKDTQSAWPLEKIQISIALKMGSYALLPI